MRILTFIGFSLLVTAFACTKNKDQQEQTETPVPTNRLTIAVGKGPDAMFLTPDEKKLYIANVEDSTISVISTKTDKVVKTISHVRNPWGFAQLGTSNEVAVSAYGNQLVVIDFLTDRVIKEKSYSSHLGGITVDSIGQYLYVVAIDAKKVIKIDANSLDSLDSYDTGNGPDGIGISKNNQKIYVTNTEDGTISVINVATKLTSLINTGGKPELVHGNRDHSLLYVSNFTENKIHVINTVDDSIFYEITGLDGPEEAVLSKSGEILYVVNFNASRVFSYNGETYEMLNETYNTGSKPIGVITMNQKLYVTNYGDNSVDVITK